jgi:hypothetical protein
MQIQIATIEPCFCRNFPVIDSEFDNFQNNNDLAANLHEAEFATFYHHVYALAE